jgi:hypothetical protein
MPKPAASAGLPGLREQPVRAAGSNRNGFLPDVNFHIEHVNFHIEHSAFASRSGADLDLAVISEHQAVRLAHPGGGCHLDMMPDE